MNLPEEPGQEDLLAEQEEWLEAMDDVLAHGGAEQAKALMYR